MVHDVNVWIRVAAAHLTRMVPGCLTMVDRSIGGARTKDVIRIMKMRLETF